MSSITTWRTKGQVQETLIELSGGRRRLGNIDSAYILMGDKPPPAMVEAEDEEIRLQFGDIIHAGKDIISENPPPDLQGITDLLRMVQGSDEEGDKEEMTTTEEPSNKVISISKGCKLNPRVKEFTPKMASSSHSSSDISENTPRSVEKTDATVSNANKGTECVTEDLATKLKNEISNASKSNSFELKKQKNVAIAALLRMYSSDNQTPTLPKPAETLKLITPDFFENQSYPENVQPETETLKTESLPAISTSPVISSMNSITQTSSSNEVKSEPTLSTQNTVNNSKPKAVDPAIKTSINKVNQWLGEQEEQVQRKSPAVYLGPITYKKKDPSTCKSPSITDTHEQEVRKPSQSNEYHPTDYAAAYLNKKCMERKSKEVVQKRNMWTDLHIVLKEKESKAKK